MMATRQRLARCCIQLAAILIVSALLIMAPEPVSDGILHIKNAVVALITVIWIGKLLVDTFFLGQ